VVKGGQNQGQNSPLGFLAVMIDGSIPTPAYLAGIEKSGTYSWVGIVYYKDNKGLTSLGSSISIVDSRSQAIVLFIAL
jgi:hypothetical protein